MEEEHFDPREESLVPGEGDLEKVLRPKQFEDFTGQQKVLDNLKVFVEAAKRRKKYKVFELYLKGPEKYSGDYGYGLNAPIRIHAISREDAIKQIKPKLRKDEKILSLKKLYE